MGSHAKSAVPIARLQRLLADRQLSISQILDNSRSRIAESKPFNAFISECSLSKNLEVSENSHSVSPLKSNQLPSAKPLLGIPFAVKDNFCVKNVRTSCASKMLESFLPSYNASVVQRLLDAGAILMGKTNMDEFAMGSGSVDSLFGPVRNPWGFPDHIAGGSSGGSAVAVASGAVQFALGSDTGGSVRNPASYCGIVGFKPTYGTVSRYGLIPLLNSTDVPSIFTKLVGDARLVYQIISGFDSNDSTTFQGQNGHARSDHEFQIRSIRVGIPKEYNVPELSEEMRDCWVKVADELENRGMTVKEISLPHSEYGNACYTVLCACDVASNMARYDGIEFGHRSDRSSSTNELYAATRHEALNEVVRGRILAGNYFLLKPNYEEFFVKAAQVRRLIANDFHSVFANEVDVILAPVTLSDAPSFSEFLSMDNRSQQEVQDLFTVGASLAGLPAVSLPVSLSKKGFPLGMQFIAPFQRDFFLLNVAEFVQDFFRFYQTE